MDIVLHDSKLSLEGEREGEESGGGGGRGVQTTCWYDTWP